MGLGLGWGLNSPSGFGIKPSRQACFIVHFQLKMKSLTMMILNTFSYEKFEFRAEQYNTLPWPTLARVLRSTYTLLAGPSGARPPNTFWCIFSRKWCIWQWWFLVNFLLKNFYYEPKISNIPFRGCEVATPTTIFVTNVWGAHNYFRICYEIC